MKYPIVIGVIIVLTASLFACTHKLTMQFTSPVFQNDDYLPKKYICNGQNVNPPLLIGNIPKNTKSLALIIDDPDAPSGN